MQVTINNQERYFDELLYSNLMALRKAVENDWDGLLLVVGREGVGKSTFAMQIASALDPTFSLDRVCWTSEQFMELIGNTPKYGAIVFDEAYLTFATRSAMVTWQKIITGMLTMIRSKNLFLIIVSPSPFDLSKYIVVHRSICLFRCYHKAGTRGMWEMYGEDRKRELYVKGKRENDWAVCHADIRGRFTHWLPFDKGEYDGRKNESVEKLRKQLLGGNDSHKGVMSPKQVMLLKRQGEANALRWLRDNQWLRHGALKSYAIMKGTNENRLREWLLKPDDTAEGSGSLENAADSAPVNNLKLMGGVLPMPYKDGESND